MDNFGELKENERIEKVLDERFERISKQKPNQKAIDEAKKDVKAFARALQKLRENKDKFIDNRIREEYRDATTGEVKCIDTTGTMTKWQAAAFADMMLKNNYRPEDLLED